MKYKCIYWVSITTGTSLSMCRPHKSMILVVHPCTQHIEDGTMYSIPLSLRILKLLEVKLTYLVSYPALWHQINPASSGLVLSLHRHRDRPLISLYFYLHPTCVSLDLKNKVVDWSVTGIEVDNKFVGILEPPDWCTIENSMWCVGGGTRDCCISKVALSLNNACIAYCILKTYQLVKPVFSNILLTITA